MKLGLSKHAGTTQDHTGCEFQYTCLSNKYYMGGELHTERHYIVYDGKGTGIHNIITEADSLQELRKNLRNI